MRVYIAKYKLGEDEHDIEVSVQDTPTLDEEQMAMKALNDMLPNGATWIHAPNESNYFLKR